MVTVDILLDVNPETTANLSPSVESVAGSARAEGSVYLQRFPLAVNSKELSLYAEVLDTVIDFRLSKLSLLVENTVFSACSRKRKDTSV